MDKPKQKERPAAEVKGCNSDLTPNSVLCLVSSRPAYPSLKRLGVCPVKPPAKSKRTTSSWRSSKAWAKLLRHTPAYVNFVATLHCYEQWCCLILRTMSWNVEEYIQRKTPGYCKRTLTSLPVKSTIAARQTSLWEVPLTHADGCLWLLLHDSHCFLKHPAPSMSITFVS